MSHVDDGALHAYLDGDLSALEAVRLESHLSECDACRTRLAEQRRLVTRASDILAGAMPREREAPPLEQLVPRSPRRGYWPLGAAAAVVLAVAVGWFVTARPGVDPATRRVAEALEEKRSVDVPTAAAAPESEGRAEAAAATVADAVEAPPPPPAEERKRPLAEPVQAPAQASGAAAESAERESTAPAVVVAPPRLEPSGAQPSAAAAPTVERAEIAANEPRPLTVAAARGLLYAEVLGVPGLPVVGLRRASQPGYASVVIVEQALDSTRSVQIVHRRPTPSEARAAAARRSAVDSLAGGDSGVAGALRAEMSATPGGVQIEVTGPLSSDSLETLRRALRPLP